MTRRGKARPIRNKVKARRRRTSRMTVRPDNKTKVAKTPATRLAETLKTAAVKASGTQPAIKIAHHKISPEPRTEAKANEVRRRQIDRARPAPTNGRSGNNQC